MVDGKCTNEEEVDRKLLLCTDVITNIYLLINMVYGVCEKNRQPSFSSMLLYQADGAFYTSSVWEYTILSLSFFCLTSNRARAIRWQSKVFQMFQRVVSCYGAVSCGEAGSSTGSTEGGALGFPNPQQSALRQPVHGQGIECLALSACHLPEGQLYIGLCIQNKSGDKI